MKVVAVTIYILKEIQHTFITYYATVSKLSTSGGCAVRVSERSKKVE